MAFFVFFAEAAGLRNQINEGIPLTTFAQDSRAGRRTSPAIQRRREMSGAASILPCPFAEQLRPPTGSLSVRYLSCKGEYTTHMAEKLKIIPLGGLNEIGKNMTAYEYGGEIIVVDCDATALGIGMVHQHFQLVDVFTVLDNIILGAETTKMGFLQKKEARKKVQELSERYGLAVDLDAKVEDITVGMQQRVEILKMLYRDNEILIFDEPTAVLTPQEIDELLLIMKNLTREGKSILFISHKLNEIMSVADRVTVLRKGKYIGTVNTKDTNKQELSNMMVGRPVQLQVNKDEAHPGDVVLSVKSFTVPSHLHKKDAVHDVSFDVRAGEIVCIAGIDGNGQTEFIHGLTGLDKSSGGSITVCGHDISHYSIHHRGEYISHIPEDRHKHGLVLDFTLEQNLVLQRYKEPQFEKGGFIKRDAVRSYAQQLIEKFDVRSGQGPITVVRSMSGGNQQKAIIARELDRDKPLIVAVQPTRGLDVGAIEYIHSQLVAERDRGKAVLLVSLELDEVMSLSDRILVMYEGEIVGQLDPKKTTVSELGLYMSGAKRDNKGGDEA